MVFFDRFYCYYGGCRILLGFAEMSLWILVGEMDFVGFMRESLIEWMLILP